MIPAPVPDRPDVLRLPAAPPRRLRRDQSRPPPEERPHPFLVNVLERLQTLNGQVAHLLRELFLTKVYHQLNHRRLERLESRGMEADASWLLEDAAGPQAAPGPSDDARTTESTGTPP